MRLSIAEARLVVKRNKRARKLLQKKNNGVKYENFRFFEKSA